jgi:hypothetical protein
MKGLPAAVLLLALGVVARANLGPVEHQNFALSRGNIKVAHWEPCMRTWV